MLRVEKTQNETNIINNSSSGLCGGLID